MSLLQNMKHELGDKCIGISLDKNFSENKPEYAKPMRFCEAVVKSFNSPLSIHKMLINCPGARRCFNINPENEALYQKIAAHNQLERHFITDALKEIPIITKPLQNIVFTKNEHMDLFITYTKPEKVVDTLIDYAVKLHEKPLISPYFIMSMCGNVFVKSIETGKITISFGCPESRRYGGIGKDEIVMGIPFEVASQLFT